MGIIDRINSSKDIKKLGYAELTMLSDEIRDFLVESFQKQADILLRTWVLLNSHWP